MPANATIRKVNELVKRSRLAKVHAYIISYIAGQMPSMFGKKAKQDEIVKTLPNVFETVSRQYNLPAVLLLLIMAKQTRQTMFFFFFFFFFLVLQGDFPDIQRFRDNCGRFDFSKHFKPLDKKMIESMDSVLAKDLPDLMQRFPQDKPKAGMLEGVGKGGNASDEDYSISNGLREKYKQMFLEAAGDNEFLTGEQVPIKAVAQHFFLFKRNAFFFSLLTGKERARQVWAG